MAVLCASSVAAKDNPKESLLDKANRNNPSKRQERVQYRALARLWQHTSTGRPIYVFSFLQPWILLFAGLEHDLQMRFPVSDG